MNLQGCSRMKCYKQEAVYNSNATIKSQYFRVHTGYTQYAWVYHLNSCLYLRNSIIQKQIMLFLSVTHVQIIKKFNWFLKQTNKQLAADVISCLSPTCSRQAHLSYLVLQAMFLACPWFCCFCFLYNLWERLC